MSRISFPVWLLSLFACLITVSSLRAQSAASVEQWGTFEMSLPGPSTGNPFTDVTLAATFTHDAKSIEAAGFYDGQGTYKIRFMPPDLGPWQYTTKSNVAELAGKSGAFTCALPSPNNHGLVTVKNTFHFDYADNTPYFEIGTTCYGWAHELIRKRN